MTLLSSYLLCDSPPLSDSGGGRMACSRRFSAVLYESCDFAASDGSFSASNSSLNSLQVVFDGSTYRPC